MIEKTVQKNTINTFIGFAFSEKSSDCPYYKRLAKMLPASYFAKK